MIDKNIQPDYSTKEEKLRLHAALPLLAPAIATAIGAAIGLTGTGLVLQKKIQNYFANNPGALDSIVSKFGTKPGDQPEVEEELKELTKPTTTPIKTWEKSFADTGTQIPEKLPESKGLEVPPQEKVSPPGFQKAEPLGIDILKKDIGKKKTLKEVDLDDEEDTTLEIPEDYEGPSISSLEDGVDSFPFSKEDFKEGALDNDIIKKTFLKINSDDGIARGETKKFSNSIFLDEKGEKMKGEYEFSPLLKDEDKFLLTPPRGQQEIMLRFLKQQLISDNADKKIIDQITTLQNDLGKKIKDSGYYGAGSEKEKNIKGLPGYSDNLVNKRKLNASGGLMDKPLTGRSRDI